MYPNIRETVISVLVCSSNLLAEYRYPEEDRAKDVGVATK